MASSQTAVHFKEPKNFLKKKLLSLLLPPRNTFFKMKLENFDIHTFRVLLTILWKCCFPVSIVKPID